MSSKQVYPELLIRSFGHEETDKVFYPEFSRRFHNIARVAKRKLDAMAGGNAMQHIRLDDSGVRTKPLARRTQPRAYAEAV